MSEWFEFDPADTDGRRVREEKRIEVAALGRVGGASVFRPKATTMFSFERVLAAEDRLLEAPNDRNAPIVPTVWIEQAARTMKRDGYVLSADQELAIAKISASARTFDIFVCLVDAGSTTCRV